MKETIQVHCHGKCVPPVSPNVVAATLMTKRPGDFGNFSVYNTSDGVVRVAHLGEILSSALFTPRRAAIVRNTPKMTARTRPNRHSP